MDCQTPADCPDPIAYACQAGACVPLASGCEADADCIELGQLFCQDGKCVQCLADADCQDPVRAVCQAGACVECRSEADCTDPAQGTCLEGVCVPGACSNDAQCVDPQAPYCLEGACFQCRTAAHCPDPDTDTCRAGSCQAAGCTNDGQCLDPQLHYCLEGACVQCRTAAHCPDPDGQRCEAGVCTQAVACGDGDRPNSFAWTCPQTHGYCQLFGVPVDYQTCGFHTGLDVCGTNGEPIVSLAEGRVVHVGPMWLDGAGVGRGPYAIIIKHSPRFYSTYGHNSRALVSEGACVSRGQTIAEMGDLGYSYGPHLHLEVVTGTEFTDDWQTPFSSACDHYEDPMDYAQP